VTDSHVPPFAYVGRDSLCSFILVVRKYCSLVLPLVKSVTHSSRQFLLFFFASTCCMNLVSVPQLGNGFW